MPAAILNKESTEMSANTKHELPNARYPLHHLSSMDLLGLETYFFKVYFRKALKNTEDT